MKEGGGGYITKEFVYGKSVNDIWWLHRTLIYICEGLIRHASTIGFTICSPRQFTQISQGCLRFATR